MRKSVSQQLLDFIRANHGWHESGNLQRLEWRNRNGTLATPRSIVRRLQELCEEGKIASDPDSKTARYSIDSPHVKKEVLTVLFPEGPREIIRCI